MCGIFGIIDVEPKAPINRTLMESVLKEMNHRGPDAAGWRRIGDHATFAHTRLSIIDLSSASDQPMVVEDRYWLVFNGEIFNFLELRTELQSQGVDFRTNGDAEVLLRAYIAWGRKCVERFNGMWGFAIYDARERTLFCSRDRYGEKPFNYALVDGRFVFASEIKSMLACFPGLAQPAMEAIENYCRTSVGAQQSQTWFRDVRRLQPGHNLFLRDGKLEIRRYWRYPAEIDWGVGFEEAREEYARVFTDAVRIRMRSDVPLGITLSAGVDSNSIAYTMQRLDPRPHHCFTSKFEREGLTRDTSVYLQSDAVVDESFSAGKVAAELGLSPHIVDTDYSSFVPQLTQIVRHLESGNSSPAVFPLMQLLKEARKHVTVVMDGQGADELLGGYVPNMLLQSVADSIVAGQFAEAMESLREYKKTYKLAFSVKMALRSLSNAFPLISRGYELSSGIAAVFGPALRGGKRLKDYPDLDDPISRGLVVAVLRRQHSGGLVNLLHYGDAISMANSIESRMPFLDHRLVEFVCSLPSNFKFTCGRGKVIHRAAMRGTVPDWIIDDPIKLGFNSPIDQQFRKIFLGSEGPLDVLFSARCRERGLFDRRGLEDLVVAHQSAKRDYGTLLFRLLSTELWFRTFIDRR